MATIFAATLLAAPALRAQIVADGATNILSNVTNAFPGNLIIGTNGSFTLLVLSDNAALGNANDAIIGANITARSNEVRLISPTAYWLVGTNLFVGSNGAFNRLTISNGALVETRTAYIGGFHFLSSNNEAVVTGAGSRWSNSSGLSLGVISTGNRLVISNGGRVSSGGSLVGVADPLDASNNTAVVTGAGSTWNNQAGLDIGYLGNSCRMVISNAAFVDNALGRIGRGGSDCEVVVTGPGSVWSNRTSLTVGESGSRARLVVTNGGAVFSLGDILLAVINPSSFSNRIVVNNGTLRATNAAGTATLSLLHGTNQFNSGVIEADFLRMANTLGFFEFNGGLLTTRGAFISNGVPFNVGTSSNTPAIWDVRASPSNHVLSVNLNVGNNSSFNQLLVTNGALLTSTNVGVIGFNSAARSNAVLIAGMGSRWTGNDIYVGSNGSLNSLTISNGGGVADLFGYLGRNSSSSNNLVVVTGTGSSWSNQFDLSVGLNGLGNQLVVSDGGVVQSEFGIVGFNAGANNNAALVTGAGSVWSNSVDLIVGRSGAGNQLVVSDGGSVFVNDSSLLGANIAGSNSVALVTGAGSLWTSVLDLSVGDDGVGCQLTVSDGGQVLSSNAVVGVNVASSNNVALVTGAGTVWSNRNNLTLGNSSVGNRLVVSNGAWIVNSNGFLGFSASSIGNLAMVSGAGTVWSNRADLYVGNSGGANQLVVSNGATVFVGGNAVLGINSGANSNSVSVLDAGTSWLITSNLYVGSNGAFNLLVVSNGARVVNHLATVGAGLFSSNNVALITGAGSLWSNRNALIVGNSGSGNRLVISNGATVRHLLGAALVGLGSSGSNNSAVVTGTGSFWDISFSGLSLGGSSGNRLLVTNGGRVRTHSGNIGSVRSDNEVLLTGTGSSWTNADLLLVGVFGDRSRLVVSNGAEFVSSVGINVGENPSSTNNRVVVDGGTLRCVNLAGNGTLEVRRGTNVLNAGLIEADLLLLTNTLGFFEFNGGTLSARNSTVNNGQPFRVGNGVSPATFNLAGNGTHSFANGLAVLTNGTLTGNGTVIGGLALSGGGTLSPGVSVGKMVLTNTVSLQGTVFMEISKNGAALTNDQIEVMVALTYGGSLTVSHLGPDALAAGDNFRLFVASSYTNAFSTLSLPTLGPELIWTNKLLVDGSIEVISIPPGDHFWTNALGGNYVIAANWLLNSVPGPRDNAVFTNNAGYQVHAIGASLEAANAFFDASTGTVTQNLAASSWLLTNSYIVGRNPSTIAAVTHTVGFLRVTNSAGDARLVIGESGRGTYNLNGGDVTADFLTVTNNGLTFTNSTFNFNFGNLLTLQGAVVSPSVKFVIGNVSNQTATWTMLGGTNRITGNPFATSETILGNLPGSRGVVVASGASTVWTNSGFLAVGGSGSASHMIVSNGAAVFSHYSPIGGANSASNAVWVTGAGSRWLTSDNLDVGAMGPNNLLVVSNGGLVAGSAPMVLSKIGNFPAANSNLAIVTGLGSVWSNSANLFVGLGGAANQLVVSNGGVVQNNFGFIGRNSSSSNNVALVTGTGSLWSLGSDLYFGHDGAGNQLVVSNSGVISCGAGSYVGLSSTASNNVARVTGSGSFWSTVDTLYFGRTGAGNQLLVSDGGVVRDGFGVLGNNPTSSNNLAVVTGSGSVWSNTFELYVGEFSAGNQLVVSNGGVVFASSNVFVGVNIGSTNNRVVVDGGTLQSTNVAGTGLLEVRRGTNVLNAGLIETDILRVTNLASSRFVFNGGTLAIKSSRISLAVPFKIGNGVSPATLHLAGNGLHNMPSTLGLVISSNATLTGNGTLAVILEVHPGGSVSPGASVGKLVLSNSPSLQGAVVMEISKNGATLTNDQIQVTAPLTYGGTLTVSNLGPTALALGDRFPLFSANSYAGAFSAVTLPSPPPGLNWTNKLLVDGSIEVIAGPKFTSVSLSGTNVIFTGTGGTPNAPYAVLTATNVVTPLTNWVSIATNLFDSSGNFSFTNGIAPGELQRYFRIRTP